jgi:hypothetical protein
LEPDDELTIYSLGHHGDLPTASAKVVVFKRRAARPLRWTGMYFYSGTVMFKSHTKSLLSRASALRDVIAGEQGILLNLGSATLGTVVLVLFCAMWNGIEDAEDLTNYLLEQNAPVGAESVSLLLAAFEGSDPAHDLWRRDPSGAYTPLLAALPSAPESEVADFEDERYPDWGQW